MLIFLSTEHPLQVTSKQRSRMFWYVRRAFTNSVSPNMNGVISLPKKTRFWRYLKEILKMELIYLGVCIFWHRIELVIQVLFYDCLWAEVLYRSKSHTHLKTFTNKLTPNPHVTLQSKDICEYRALFDLGASDKLCISFASRNQICLKQTQNLW